MKITDLLPVVVILIMIIYFVYKYKYKNKKMQEIRNKLYNYGFNDDRENRKIVLNLTSRMVDIENELFWSVGIWTNYEKKMIAMRLSKNDFDLVVLPFNIIQDVEIYEDIDTKMRGSGVGVGVGAIGIGFGDATATGVLRRLQIRVVAKNVPYGTKAYTMILYDSTFPPGRSSNHDAIRECANSIVDEIRYIIRHYQ